MNVGNRSLGVIFAWMMAGSTCLITERALAQGSVVPSGTGTSGDPYRISQLGHLVWMRANIGSSSGKFYTVQNDIEAAETTNWNSGAGFAPIGTNWMPRFSGFFNGNGKAIRNLWINRTNEDSVGLFGYLGSNAVVINLGIAGGRMAGISGVGGLAGANYGTITGCYSSASIFGSESQMGCLVGWNAGLVLGCSASGNVQAAENSMGSLGGLVGSNQGFIHGCRASGMVTGSTNVFAQWIGGLLGLNDGNGMVSNCYAAGSVFGSDNIGGLIGGNHGRLITECYATGAVTGLNYSAGGLIGDNNGLVTRCHASGTVAGHYSVGGLIGSHASFTANVCYATGSVTGDFKVGGLIGSCTIGAVVMNSYALGGVAGGTAGGLVGANEWSDVVISNCFAAGPVAGAGLVGQSLATTTNSYWDTNTTGAATSQGGEGKSTAQMKQQATFAGWDFITTWGIVENVGYPYLRHFIWNGAMSFPAGLPTGDREPNYTAWVTDQSMAWQASDFTSLSVDDFVSAWLVDVEPAPGVATSCQFRAASFLAAPSDLAVGLELQIGGSNKAGRINGWLSFRGATSLTSSWQAVASQQDGDKNITFIGGTATAAFEAPVGARFYSPTIVKAPLLGLAGIQPIDTP
ncbi:MAG: hypothetical protein KA118_17215 [Verrucomicrobia bacterium]|nr:hypothetical protein [Verrucomicrobiota bacterium]